MRETEAAKGKKLTTVERQDICDTPELRPSPAMVWLPAHTGAVLDHIESERFAPLFVITAACGAMRC
jgi:hypothetical protein